MVSNFLADCVIFVHLAYVAFAVIGLLLTLIGLGLRWQWVRNLRFRVAHLVMVEVVALEGWFNIRCPLTDVEWLLRAERRADTDVMIARWSAAPVAPAADATTIAEEEAEFQPVFQQDDPERQPEKKSLPADEQAADDASNTFVGRLLGAVLYVRVPQATLDQWYVGFGLLTLAVFLAFPPRRGCWSRPGFCALVLLWIGSLFFASTVYDWLFGHSIDSLYAPMVFDNAYPPLATGAGMILLGICCGLRARRCGQAKCAAPTDVSGTQAEKKLQIEN